MLTIPNSSPWLRQLNAQRKKNPLTTDIESNIVIVGGGIAGICTAYYILKENKQDVLLLEADKIAHGATGHNAGQLVSYFERPFNELVAEFGLEAAAEAQRAIENVWTHIDEMYRDAGLRTPLYRFTGYAGIATNDQLLKYLEHNAQRQAGGLTPEGLTVVDEPELLASIPEKYQGLYTTAPRQAVLDLLETDNHTYLAALWSQKGCMNSALFTEEILQYLETFYPGRFRYFEFSPVKEILLRQNTIELKVKDLKVSAAKVVLCTNGFENFSIINEVGTDIDTSFHHTIMGRIGYMAGYIDQLNNPPTAISYFPRKTDNNDPTGEPYVYITRRPHEHENTEGFNLVCAGGPEKVLPNMAIYSREDSCSEDIRQQLDDFLRDNYRHHPGQGPEYAFCWHGLMGFTPNGIRRIGMEPRDKRLLYNLGCNGVGILPSIYGGWRIGQIIKEVDLPASIFDPLEQSI